MPSRLLFKMIDELNNKKTKKTQIICPKLQSLTDSRVSLNTYSSEIFENCNTDPSIVSGLFPMNLCECMKAEINEKSRKKNVVSVYSPRVSVRDFPEPSELSESSS